MVVENKKMDHLNPVDQAKLTRQNSLSVGRGQMPKKLAEEPSSLHKQESNDNNQPSPPSRLEGSPEPPIHRNSPYENLLRQVDTWLKRERERRHAQKAKWKASQRDGHKNQIKHHTISDGPADKSQRRRGSESSTEGTAALDQLAQILDSAISVRPSEVGRRIPYLRKGSSGLRRHSAISSDSDYFESIDQLVPSCDAILDNSNTLTYGVDEHRSESACIHSKSRLSKEKEAWADFRFEILRIAHTLKLKGWRRVSMNQSDEISVQRLSGALTNAVYVVAPPKNLFSTRERSDDGVPQPINPPPKLLLRIYGPQVEHLIDRKSELQILLRLARKRIGPRLLGTFRNGRFEEFLDARALTSNELRVSETSIQIAKRMRELHEGVELLPNERRAGPFVWQNWDKWVDRCEQIVSWLDQQAAKGSQSPSQKFWANRKGERFVCGVEWPVFRKTVEKYRKWLEKQYGGAEEVNERMVFAHNDTQYGNILRMEPKKESPLLLPANQHKRLVVIDFEYANANLPGLEFANHFTEWAYNYHDQEASWRCRTQFYPNLEQQHQFIHAYLTHNTTSKATDGYNSSPTTPNLVLPSLSGSVCAATAIAAPTKISEFMLDSRAPPGEKFQEQEAQIERQTQEEVNRLIAETKLWRLANSAMWIAWGIVQARIPGMSVFETLKHNKDRETVEGLDAEPSSYVLHATTSPHSKEEEEEEGEEETIPATQDTDLVTSQDEEEFDYLSYAHDRALFLWGDAIQLGIVRAEDLPPQLQQNVKIVEH